MFDLIIGALLPVTVILVLGFVAGWYHEFDKDQANGFNQMVILFALPMCLFCSIIALPLKELIAQKDLVIGLFIGCVIMYWAIFAISTLVFKIDKGISALVSITITCPAVSSMGFPILGTFFGQISSLSVSIVNICLNLLLVPFTIICILPSNGNEHQTTRDIVIKNVKHVFKQPIVIAPIVALVIAFFHIKFPISLISAFDMLGRATGGLAIFTCGLMLYSYKISITKRVWFIVILANLVVPVIVWSIISLIGFPQNMIRETILTLAIPSTNMALILSIQYNKGQQLMTSEFFLSTILSFATLSLFIYLLY